MAAAAEERFSRNKHTGEFPVGAISYVLDAAGLEAGDLDEVAHGFDYEPYRAAFMLDPVAKARFEEVYSRQALLDELSRHMPDVDPERVHGVDHHLSHAASAYLTSGWDDCLVLVVDGMGEVNGASAYQGSGGRLTHIDSISARDSIGILYSLITFHLGFDFNADEYKIMGLAPYGDPTRFAPSFDDAVRLQNDGSFSIAGPSRRFVAGSGQQPALGVPQLRVHDTSQLQRRIPPGENAVVVGGGFRRDGSPDAEPAPTPHPSLSGGSSSNSSIR